LVVNDNFGIIISALFRTPQAGGIKTVILQNDLAQNKSVNVYDISSGNCFNDVNVLTVGTALVQVGKGTTPATRQDFNTENVFPDSPEADKNQVTRPAGYNSGLGKITIATQITPTGGVGAITEVNYFLKWQEKDTGTIQTFMLFRNILGTPVNFIVAQTINVDQEILI